MSETMEIPDAAVDAACLAMNDGVRSSYYRERWEPEVRTILVAARPYLMPTRDQIGAALDPTAFIARKSDASYDQRRKLALQDADTVVALLNGSKS